MRLLADGPQAPDHGFGIKRADIRVRDDGTFHAVRHLLVHFLAEGLQKVAPHLHKVAAGA
jgi:hypothetical protein